jgi:hypothetical protein
VKRNRPLDFLIISGHAEYMGIADLILTDDPGLLANPYGKRWYDMFKSGSEGGFDATKEVFFSITEGKELWKDGKMKCAFGSGSQASRLSTTTQASSPRSTATSGHQRRDRVTIFTVW